MKLSIIFPAYNEQKRILPVLENYYKFFKLNLKGNFEFIIVPNNCSDKTFEISSNFSKNKENVSVENIPFYVGKGGAVMRGFELAKGDLIGFVDSDQSTSPNEFFKLIKNIKSYSGIIASRRINGAKVIPRRKLGKRVSSLFFYFLTKILFSMEYYDTQCGAKLFTKNVAKYLSINVKEKGWIFDIDILNLCKKRDWKIREYPINWKDDEGSHISTLEGIKSVYDLIRYRFTF